jgi:hypothetical protein
MPNQIKGLSDRHAARIIVEDTGFETPCLTWTGSKTTAGYGNVRIGGVNHYVHRLVYEAHHGPIPKRINDDRAVLDHRCRNRACANINHLELVTNRENILRGDIKRAQPKVPGPRKPRALKTHCKRGHEFTTENTYLKPDGRRECRSCMQAHRQERTAREREQRPPAAPRTHCDSGHEYTPENTYRYPNGKRRCRECMREQDRRRRATPTS